MAMKCNACDCPEQWYRNEWTWKKAVIDILCQLVNVEVAASSGVVRNDGGSSTFTAANGEASFLAVDSHGRQYLAPDGILPLPGTGATNLGKAEDSVHTDGDVGVAVWGVSSTSPQTAFGALGDYSPLKVNAGGCLYANIDFNGQENTSRGILKAEDGAHASGDAGVAVWAKRTDTPAVSSGTDGDYSTINENAYGAVYNDSAFKAQAGLEGTLAFGSVTTSYATLISNSTQRIRRLSVYNTLNQVALISVDGGTTGCQHVPATSGVVSIDLAANGLYSVSNISVKTIGGNPGSGNIYAVASY